MTLFNKEYKNLLILLVFGLFLSGIVRAQSDSDENLSMGGSETTEEQDVEEYLKNKIGELKKELSERERFLEHTYFYYHEHLQSVRSKNLSAHPFFHHYETCLKQIDSEKNTKSNSQNYCTMISQVFVDALWDLDARWRQMRTSGVRYKRRPGKVSPSSIYLSYLLSHPEYAKSFKMAESLRLTILSLKNDLLPEFPAEDMPKYLDTLDALEKGDMDSGEILHSLKAAFAIIIDGKILQEKKGEELVDSALDLDIPALTMLKQALAQDYGVDYLKLSEKDLESDNESDEEKQFPLSDLLNWRADFKQMENDFKDATPDESSNSEEFSKWQNLERLLKYRESPRIFVLCRKNREIPCLLMIKNSDGTWAQARDKKTKTATIWHQKVMASSNKGWHFYKRLGHTPAGVYTIDGVMPFTNRQRLFGKFHRLIINYLPGSAGDLSYTRYFLPESMHELNWWKQAPLAKILGRNLMRIHGTGKRARPGTGYYPLVKTNGCIAEIEGQYFGKKQTGQKDLLDKLQELTNSKSQNGIHALLYVVEVKGEDRPIEMKDIDFNSLQSADDRS